MGDFVSKKLLDLIDYLDGKSSDENLGQTANQIMEAVGDPFLKERLRDLYIEYKQKLRNNGTTAS
jgi:transcriptional accessory protein Tex/SPT6